MTDTVAVKIHAGGRLFHATARRTTTGWVVTCEGRRETLTTAGRTITDAHQAMQREIERRIAKHRA